MSRAILVVANNLTPFARSVVADMSGKQVRGRLGGAQPPARSPPAPAASSPARTQKRAALLRPPIQSPGLN